MQLCPVVGQPLQIRMLVLTTMTIISSLSNLCEDGQKLNFLRFLAHAPCPPTPLALAAQTRRLFHVIQIHVVVASNNGSRRGGWRWRVAAASRASSSSKGQPSIHSSNCEGLLACTLHISYGSSCELHCITFRLSSLDHNIWGKQFQRCCPTQPRCSQRVPRYLRTDCARQQLTASPLPAECCGCAG